jgi:lipoate-protein ligase A
MIFVDNKNCTDPRINLAIEEHLLRSLKTETDILLFYINEPSIIVGRNQNVFEEINYEYAETHAIHVIRRLSGGGTVYHDLGNLNFSFINNTGKENLLNFKKFTAPVVKALQQMGIPAQLGTRFDILVNGRKISGNAQYNVGNRMVSHGTLLYNSDLEKVNESLRVNIDHIQSKSIKSVRSQVSNICEFLENPGDIFSFRDQLMTSILEDTGSSQYVLNSQDWETIHQLSQSRYHTWEWNYGRSPEFEIKKKLTIDGGDLELKIIVANGLVKRLEVSGATLILPEDVTSLENHMLGSRFAKQDLLEALQSWAIPSSMESLSKPELVSQFFK